ncbi:MAG: IPT/TIG domain-containing protein [Myxococcota bacterium]
MTASTLITSVSEALADLVEENLNAGSLDSIVLETSHTYPDDVSSLSTTADVIVNLLLVGGEVSGHHRNLEGLPGKRGTPLPQQLPFVARYLVSIHSSGTDGINEQQVFTHVMLNFFEEPYFKVAMPEPYELFSDRMGLELQIELLSHQELYDMWSILGQEFRTSLAVSVGVIPLARPQPAPQSRRVDKVVFETGVSQWGGAPTIDSVSDEVVAPGATLTVTGQRFQGPQGDVTFLIHGEQVAATIASASSATVTVPSDLPRGKTSLEARSGTTLSEPVGLFVDAPAIYDISPRAASQGDTIMLSGAKLDSSNVEVMLGADVITPSSTSADQLEFDVPPGTIASTYAVQITSDAGDSNVTYLEVQ